MDKNKLFSLLCYFSVFFAPFLFPIVMYFIADDVEVKDHAKKSLMSHVIPFLTFIIVIGAAMGTVFINPSEAVFFSFFAGGMIITGVINLIIFVYNIVRGIKLLAN